jgi:hypothetical protein
MAPVRWMEKHWGYYIFVVHPVLGDLRLAVFGRCGLLQKVRKRSLLRFLVPDLGLLRLQQLLEQHLGLAGLSGTEALEAGWKAIHCSW